MCFEHPQLIYNLGGLRPLDHYYQCSAIQALCGVQSTDDKSLIFINLKKNYNNILLILAQKPKKTNCLLKIEGEKIYNTSSLSCFCLKKNANQFHVSLFGKLSNWYSRFLGRIGDWTMGEIISCTVPVLKKIPLQYRIFELKGTQGQKWFLRRVCLIRAMQKLYNFFIVQT